MDVFPCPAVNESTAGFHNLKLSGSEFQTVGPATEKHGFQTSCGEHVEQTGVEQAMGLGGQMPRCRLNRARLDLYRLYTTFG